MRRFWVIGTPAALLAIVASAVLVAVAVLPGARRQLALSMERGPSSFVEVFVPAGRKLPGCDRPTKSLHVEFDLVSHLASASRIHYVVFLRGRRGDGPPSSGQVTLAPGERTRVRRAVPAAGGRPFEVVVSLPGRGEGLRLRCRAPGGGR